MPAAEGWDGGVVVIGVRGGDGDRDVGARAMTARGAIAEKACVAEGLAISAQWDAFTCG
ncbi:MAG: hypothetical protein JNL21_07040 [Myxococcales bacterium]|nr:hypothetical protein [Myxococcales bacterium]